MNPAAHLIAPPSHLLGRLACWALRGHRLQLARRELLPTGTAWLTTWRCTRCGALRWTYAGVEEGG